MAAEILDGDYYSAIQNALGVTEDELAQTEIDDPYVLPFVEGVMIDKLPSWESLNDFKTAAFKRAVMLRVAIVLIPRISLKAMKSESDGIAEYSRFANINWIGLEASLWKQYYEALSFLPEIQAAPDKSLFYASTPSFDPVTGL